MQGFKGQVRHSHCYGHGSRATGLRRWRRGWHWPAFEHADGYGPKRPDLNYPKNRLRQTGFHCGDSKVSELCVYVATSIWGCWTWHFVSLLQRCFSLQDGQDLTLAMVPAEGVAADLSHLNMKCKVSWMGNDGNRAPETSGFKIFKCFALKT